MNKKIISVIYAIIAIGIYIFIVKDYLTLLWMGSMATNVIGSIVGGDTVSSANTLLTILKVGLIIPMICVGLSVILNLVTLNSYKFSIVTKILQIISVFIIVIMDLVFCAINFEMDTSMLNEIAYLIGIQDLTISIILLTISFILLIISTACIGSVSKMKTEHGIQWLTGQYAGAFFNLDNETLIIGTDPKLAQIVLNDENVSRKHIEIAYDHINNVFSLTDYSKNGTFIDGTNNQIKLNPSQKYSLYSGTKVTIANKNESFTLV